MRSLNLENHISCTSAEAVNQICQPLFSYCDVSYFDYFREFSDGSRIWLSNSAAWTKHLYSIKHYEITHFELPASTVKIETDKKWGMYLWKNLNDYLSDRKSQAIFTEKLNIARESFNIDHGLSVIKSYESYTDYFSFGTTSEKYRVIDFYLNNADFLHTFCNYFVEKADALIKASIKDKIVQANHKEILMITDSENPERAPYTLLNSQYALTKRESECLQYVSKYFSAKEIALKLGISHRTVEKHIDNIKMKLNCDKKSELINLVNTV